MLIPFHQLKAEFKRVLLKLNFTEAKAEACARIFAENSRDGVYTHGLNRFPVFVQYVQEGLIVPDAIPTLVDQMGAIERWDGNLGPGILNAEFCMERAITLAKENGIGCVAIRNTNHWMRGGTYAWQAAETGCISISFTNTIANLPPWGGIDPRLGNNPLVIAVPRNGGHVVLDMAITQYSFGKLYQYKAAGEQLPLPGGYDQAGKLTTDPGAIIESQRPIPVGFWKGSGLSLVLDLLATVLSKGNSTEKITQKAKESGVSQVFICIRPDGDELTAQLIEQIIDYTKTSRTESSKQVQYPGEGTLKTRHRNMNEGIPVDEEIWQKVKSM
ncbi:MAG: 3-dehydro-L-gulonate 2-dehydrogenase [Bacteroidota bacterium]